MDKKSVFHLLQGSPEETQQIVANKIFLPLVEDIARRAQRFIETGQNALSELKAFWHGLAPWVKRKQERKNHRPGYRFQRALASGMLAVSMISGSLMAPPPARAATLVVTSLTDAGLGSLRAAVTTANETPGIDVITFDETLFGHTITLSSQLLIEDSVEITGPGREQLTLELSGSAHLSIDNEEEDIAVTISGLSIIGDNSTDGAFINQEDLILSEVLISDICGGSAPIKTIDGSMSLIDSEVSGNDCTGTSSSQAAGAVYSLNSNLSIENSTISGNTGSGSGGVFSFFSDVSIEDSTISANTGGYYVGGVFSYTCDLSIENSAISGNTGGVSGGVFSSRSDLSITTGSVIEDNINTGYGYWGGGGGGGIYSLYDNSMKLSDVTVTGNSSYSGGGISSLYATGPTSIERSVISGNHAEFAGGGLYMYSMYGETTISGSTISGNTAENGGGFFITYSYNPLLIENSTISGNTAESGGGIYTNYAGSISLGSTTVTNNTASDQGGGLMSVFYEYGPDQLSMTLENSIVANNLSQGEGSDLVTESAQISLSYSLVQAPGDADVITIGSGNLLEQDAHLGPLADNGGPTFTHMPAFDSPVINTGNPNFSGLPEFDQRGNARVIGGRQDMGALELNAGSLAFEASTIDVSEDAETVLVTVTRQGGGEGAVSVNYASSNGSATSGEDYTAVAGTLSWASGEMGSKTFTVNILDDRRQETSETVILTLSSPIEGVSIGTSTATLTILDNDFNIFLPVIRRTNP